MMQRDKLMKKILFICTGNTCRSPMAMAVFGDLAKKANISNWVADSAGLAAMGDEINPNSVKALAKIGIDFKNYRSKSLTTDLLLDSDLIVTMTKDQALFLKSFLKESEKIRVLNIPDPFGGDGAVYENCLEEIIKGIKEILKDVKNDK